MPTLSATYASPTGTKTFTQELPATTSRPSSSSQPEGTEGTKDTEDTKETQDPSASQTTSQPVSQSAYLTSLSTSLKTLQADLNAFLTQKMEEDKATAANDVSEKDKKAEEEYGEEGGSGED